MHSAFEMLWDIPWPLEQWPESIAPDAPPMLAEVTTDGTAGLPDDSDRVGPFRACQGDAVWLQVPEVGTFSVDGRQVRLCPSPECDNRLRDFALTGPVAALVLRGAGLVPIHGTAIHHQRYGTSVIVGNAGVGVSTLAGAMVYRGWRLVGDELLALVPRPGALPLVVAGQQCLQVPPDSAMFLARALRLPTQTPQARCLLPVPSISGYHDVTTFVRLTDDAIDEPRVSPVTGLNRIELILSADWHRNVRRAQGYHSDDFIAAAKITRHTRMVTLSRLDTPEIHAGRLSLTLARHLARTSCATSQKHALAAGR